MDTYRGGAYQNSTLWEVLDKARGKALTKQQLKTPPRAEAVRHVGVSWRLNAGVPAVYVAEWRATAWRCCNGSTPIAWTEMTGTG